MLFRSVKMKQIVTDGALGRILWMRGRYGKAVDENYTDTWRADPALAGGGILIDQGIHMLDLFLHLAGDFDEVQAMVSHLYWNLPGIEDNVFAQFRNSTTGCVASLHSTMIQWRHLFALEVFMERGYMVLNGLKTGSGSYGAEQRVVARNRAVAPAAVKAGGFSQNTCLPACSAAMVISLFMALTQQINTASMAGSDRIASGVGTDRAAGTGSVPKPWIARIRPVPAGVRVRATAAARVWPILP